MPSRSAAISASATRRCTSPAAAASACPPPGGPGSSARLRAAGRCAAAGRRAPCPARRGRRPAVRAGCASSWARRARKAARSRSRMRWGVSGHDGEPYDRAAREGDAQGQTQLGQGGDGGAARTARRSRPGSRSGRVRCRGRRTGGSRRRRRSGATKNTSPAMTRVCSSAASDMAASATGRPSARVTPGPRTCFSLIAKVATIAAMAPATMKVTSVCSGGERDEGERDRCRPSAAPPSVAAALGRTPRSGPRCRPTRRIAAITLPYTPTSCRAPECSSIARLIGTASAASSRRSRAHLRTPRTPSHSSYPSHPFVLLARPGFPGISEALADHQWPHRE